MLTRNSLAVILGGEERPGLTAYGYWRQPPPPSTEPLFPYGEWPSGIEVRRGLLVGDDWSVVVWDIAVSAWPDPSDWADLLAKTLKRLTAAGAVVAWFGLEGHFADPPSLFDPAEMSGGVFAAYSPKLGFRCTAQLDEEFRALTDKELLRLKSLIEAE